MAGLTETLMRMRMAGGPGQVPERRWGSRGEVGGKSFVSRAVQERREVCLHSQPQLQLCSSLR